MATIIVNGKRFEGDTITVRDGKVVIDGKPQDGKLHGDVELQVTDDVPGRAQCVASVSCENAGGPIQAEGSVTAGDRAGGGIRAVAFASTGDGRREKKQR